MNHQEITPDYRPETISYPRLAAKTALVMLVYHAVSWLLYVLFIGNNMDPGSLPDDAVSRLSWSLFWYAAVMLAVVGIVFVGLYFKDVGQKQAYLTATSVDLRGAGDAAEGRARYGKIALKESLVCTLSVGILWMIPTLFYTVSLATSGQGYGYTDAWFLEKFFIGFIGLCEPFKNAWIGLSLGLAFLFACHYLGRVISHKTWQKNRIRR